jgi:hypothetical protein
MKKNYTIREMFLSNTSPPPNFAIGPTSTKIEDVNETGYWCVRKKRKKKK